VTASEPQIGERCQAWIGLGQVCNTPPIPGRRFCTFHDSFAGPWTKFVIHTDQPRQAATDGFWTRVRRVFKPDS
jgi:hypothetical protein